MQVVRGRKPEALRYGCYVGNYAMVTNHTHLQISVHYDADIVRHFDTFGKLVGVHQVAHQACRGDAREHAFGLAADGFRFLFAHRI